MLPLLRINGVTPDDLMGAIDEGVMNAAKFTGDFVLLAAFIASTFDALNGKRGDAVAEAGDC